MAAIEPDPRRVSKRRFISRVASRSGQPIRVVNLVYESILDELMAAVCGGENVVLTGFGRFYRQAHKGHKVRFGKNAVGDYPVLKFSASRSMNQLLEDDPAGQAYRDEAIEEDFEDESGKIRVGPAVVAS